MSLPNCCKVVRNLFSLLSCLAPQAGGNCWLAREEEEEEDGPLLKPLGGDGAPFNAVGEWLVPLVNVVGVNELVLGAPWVVGGGGMVGGVSLDCVFTSTGESGIVECFSVRYCRGPEMPTIRHGLRAANKSSRPARGRETAAQAAGGARGWERGEQRRAASLPSPDDPRPQKSKRAEEKLQLLFPPHHPLSLFFFFFFKGGSARERLLVPRERTRTKNKAKSPSRDS